MPDCYKFSLSIHSAMFQSCGDIAAEFVGFFHEYKIRDTPSTSTSVADASGSISISHHDNT